jgi:NADPH2:quinone reductase
MIKRKGTIVSVGNASGAVPPFAPLKLSAKNVKLARPTYARLARMSARTDGCLCRMMGYLAEPEETSAYGAQLFELIAAGTLKVAIHKEYPFSAQGVRDAQTDLVAGQTTGKLVIKVADEV